MSKLFISHSSQDDAFVRDLREALADHGQAGWIDSRELRAGDLLWTTIQAAIEAATAYAVVVSVDGLQSKWVGKELRHALKVHQERGKDKFAVFPLSLNGTKLGVLEEFFDGEPLYIPVSSAAGGVQAAMDAILVALGKRLPTDVAATPQPPAEALEELVLQLSDFKFAEQDGLRRASARARLVYEPATPGQPSVSSPQSWRMLAPIGPIEADDLRWYLEQYAIWPSPYFAKRANKIEADLQQWGQSLYQAAMPVAQRENVMAAWANLANNAGRRFSVQVDTVPEAGTPQAEVAAAKEAATTLLGLPWELLHDGGGSNQGSYLFQGAKPTRVRRRLPGTVAFPVLAVAPPIRILLITARPEDKACGYIDHRASARPLVDAMETMPGLVSIHVLCPPTMPALRAELERAREAKKPYHVVHFDGHGVYDQQVGLGGLCFEDPADSTKLSARRHALIHTDALGPLLRDYRIPLVFLEACQSAQAAQASESVASELLKVGVASVVAMSHSVLVETARRFVASFYSALVAGKRVGAAMLAGQRDLESDKARGSAFGVGQFYLHDWFVPVLFQEKDDPQLFTSTPAKQTVADAETQRKARLGALPAAPATGFIGRSHELLALERLLRPTTQHQGLRYAVLQGQGGEGKTALATEFARWMLRSQQVARVAFVSVEVNSHRQAVLDALGRQLVGAEGAEGAEYSVATFADEASAILPIQRILREQATLLVLDNMESILPPPYIAQAAALHDDARLSLDAILALCQDLAACRDTWLIFTSREALPAPFAAPRHQIPLQRLARADAVKLVESVLNADGGGAGAASDVQVEQIEQLVDAVHGHARTLALLAVPLRTLGVAQTRSSVVALMQEMDRKFPGNRELSVFASVALSLERLSSENQDRVGALALFHGSVDLVMLADMMQWQKADVAALAQDLLQTGLATRNSCNHLTLNPALCPYLRGRTDAAQQAALTPRWVESMLGYVGFLCQQRNQNAEVAATLTLLELANLFALQDLVQQAGDAVATIDLATKLYSLLQKLGKRRLLQRVGQVRDDAAAALGDAWNHARFDAESDRIQQQLDGGQLQQALAGAQALHQQAQAAGAAAYPNADYDLAVACWLLARVLGMAGAAEQALPLLDAARQRFDAFAAVQPGCGAEGMAAVCITEQGDCLCALGRLDEAAEAYQASINQYEQAGNQRSVAVGKSQLGTVHMQQGRYPEALAAFDEARQHFSSLGEPGTVAGIWRKTGRVYQESGQPQAAEDAYRKSLSIEVQQGNVTGQANTLFQLGNLYGTTMQRPEDAIGFFRQAADKYAQTHDVAGEGRARNNLASTLHKLHRLGEAREEVRRAIACAAQFGHASTPWASWATLAAIETEAANPSAASAARAKAIASYLAYRQAGGENHYPDGRLSLAVTQALLAGDTSSVSAQLQQYAANPEAVAFHSFIHALLAILSGSRAPSLADAPDLSYSMVAEIKLLSAMLANPPPPSASK